MDLIVGYGTDVGLQRQGKPNQDKVEVFLPTRWLLNLLCSLLLMVWEAIAAEKSKLYYHQ